MQQYNLTVNTIRKRLLPFIVFLKIDKEIIGRTNVPAFVETCVWHSFILNSTIITQLYTSAAIRFSHIGYQKQRAVERHNKLQ